MTTDTFAPIEGGRLFYRLEGNPDLPVLLFSNSLGTDHSMWQPQVAALSGKFRLLRYDSRGHGASTATEGYYTIEMLGIDVLELLDHLKLAKVCYCGLSVGGVVGQWLALHAPERFFKVALCNTAAKIGTTEAWNTRIESVRKGGVASISQTILARWFTESFHRSHPETVERIRKTLEGTSAQAYAATCAAIRDIDYRNAVSGIDLRTLVISGTHDQASPAKDGRFLADQIPGAQYVELDAAHLSNLELSDQFSEALLSFLIS
jgi:3-oxoadipate enol-lactonase